VPAATPHYLVGSHMEVIWNAVVEAAQLLGSGAPFLFEIIFLSLRVSAIAVGIAMVVGIPIGYLLGVGRFFGRRLSLVIVNTGMGLPPVVAGLIVFMFLSRSGPLGDLRLLFSTPAMIIAQVFISTPLVAGVTTAAVASVPLELRLQARSLGASWGQEAVLTIKEARRGVMAAVVAGFGGIISEVGAVMIVGGNIEHSTRVMTTAIVLEARKGNFGTALALGFILIGISFVINGLLTTLQQSGARYER